MIMAAKEKKEITETLELPEKVSAKVDGAMVELSGPKGGFKRNISDPLVEIKAEGKNVKIHAVSNTKKAKTRAFTFKAHIKNMIKGVTEGHYYELKICASHFPMNVSVSGKDFIVKNFLGEKTPRKFRIKDGAAVKVDGTKVTVEGIDKEIVGQTAADIEQLCRITNRDRRVFQDGIYIVNKDGKEM